MTTMSKRYKTIALLLSIALIIGFYGCGKSKTTKMSKRNKSSTAENIPKNILIDSTLTTTSVTEQEDIPIELRVLSSEDFGRDNPFVPLVELSKPKSTKIAEKIIEDRPKVLPIPSDKAEPNQILAKTAINPSEFLPDVRLTLIIDGKTAIFAENGSSKVLSVGEAISGMKIQEIKKDGAILIYGTKKYIATTVGKLEEIPSQAKIQQTPKTPTEKTLKSPKMKKR
jgi:hypothetical protein